MTRRLLVKDPSRFIPHGYNLEARLELQTGYLTPNELFFVRNSGRTPLLSADTYRLRVEGDAVARPLELGYDELCGLPSRTTIAYLDCAGNWRSFFMEVMGRSTPGTQWRTGAAGCAEWTGVPLATVLALAGVDPRAQDVNLVGLDDSGFCRPIPLAKALDEDTLLAYRMNGAPLPPDHGFPLRAIVPGWVGSNSIKWLGRIEVSSRKVWVETNTSAYVMIGPEWPKAACAPADGAPITTQTIKSCLALPWQAALSPGRHLLRGVAFSPFGRIRQVSWELDGAGAWHPAQLVSPALPNAWAWFEFSWDAGPGPHTLRVRATDESGNLQPLDATFNAKGYLFNGVLPHPVQVG